MYELDDEDAADIGKVGLFSKEVIDVNGCGLAAEGDSGGGRIAGVDGPGSEEIEPIATEVIGSNDGGGVYAGREDAGGGLIGPCAAEEDACGGRIEVGTYNGSYSSLNLVIVRPYISKAFAPSCVYMILGK